MPAVLVGGAHVQAAHLPAAQLHGLAVHGGAGGQQDGICGQQAAQRVAHRGDEARGEQACGQGAVGTGKKRRATDAEMFWQGRRRRAMAGVMMTVDRAAASAATIDYTQPAVLRDRTREAGAREACALRPAALHWGALS